MSKRLLIAASRLGLAAIFILAWFAPSFADAQTYVVDSESEWGLQISETSTVYIYGNSNRSCSEPGADPYLWLYDDNPESTGQLIASNDDGNHNSQTQCVSSKIVVELDPGSYVIYAGYYPDQRGLGYEGGVYDLVILDHELSGSTTTTSSTTSTTTTSTTTTSTTTTSTTTTSTTTTSTTTTTTSTTTTTVPPTTTTTTSTTSTTTTVQPTTTTTEVPPSTSTTTVPATTLPATTTSTTSPPTTSTTTSLPPTTTSTSTTTSTVPSATTVQETTTTSSTSPVKTESSTPSPTPAPSATTTTSSTSTTIPVQTSTTVPAPSTTPFQTTSLPPTTTVPLTPTTDLDEAEKKVVDQLAQLDEEIAEAFVAVVDGDITVEEIADLVQSENFDDLDDTALRIVAQAVNEAPDEVKDEFEAEVNIFGNDAFDTYVPSGSRVDTATRRVIVAVAASATVVASSTRRVG